MYKEPQLINQTLIADFTYIYNFVTKCRLLFTGYYFRFVSLIQQFFMLEHLFYFGFYSLVPKMFLRKG